jgi:hypothetical protein
MRLAARSRIVAISLAIAALGPAAASARPFEPIPGVHVNSSTGYATPRAQTAGPPILARTQAAEQAATDALRAREHASPVPRNATYSTAALNGYGSGHPAVVQAPKSPSAQPGNGFDWGDAAIGAAAGLSLTLLVLGGALVLSHRRSRTGESAKVAIT